MFWASAAKDFGGRRQLSLILAKKSAISGVPGSPTLKVLSALFIRSEVMIKYVRRSKKSYLEFQAASRKTKGPEMLRS